MLGHKTSGVWTEGLHISFVGSLKPNQDPPTPWKRVFNLLFPYTSQYFSPSTRVSSICSIGPLFIHSLSSYYTWAACQTFCRKPETQQGTQFCTLVGRQTDRRTSLSYSTALQAFGAGSNPIYFWTHTQHDSVNIEESNKIHINMGLCSVLVCHNLRRMQSWDDLH